ncbi:hypothetical protein ACERK3_08415 [Phycisphaerales bacterium AB-hyl4]|uniref:Uncharacterized protein n=1 Tax=Natronomicrosphaera hydrolytica TaxID=3242702 RepID=A0ABV4U3Z0_9BACT
MLVMALVTTAIADDIRFREIFPLPRVGHYQDEIVPIGANVSLQSAATFDSDKLAMAAEDMSDYLTRRYGQSISITHGEPADSDADFRIAVLHLDALSSELRKKLFTDTYDPALLPSGNLSRQLLGKS